MLLKRILSKVKNKLDSTLFGGHKPDFLIVGAQKSGTTSLFSYLEKRGGFVGSKPKEVHYFDREDNYARGSHWYHSHFIKRPGVNGLVFEASPEYLSREKVAKRLKRYNPDLKIIILLREPISRAYSAWNMYRQWSNDGFVPWAIANDQHGRSESPIYRIFFKNGCPSFSDYIDIEMNLIKEGNREEEPSLLRRGLYKQQIERYVEMFGWENILILGFNELKSDAESVIRKCHEFLGVSYQAPDLREEKEIKNKRAYPSKINPNDLAILKKFYEKPNEELFKYLGFQPDW
ncbi:sulfotransferase domain-containing protein [Idiomarina abyssalis]|uniref:Sulfotransferase domain-containing protein n=1 Tax=Idiomarina abyssalis TaxID=86102 RepID=A0A8I1G7Y6_9GAMM|nr:sulfotransferase domain-containing protein [Idiomarina abyssalis]MBJ7265756.1 sulfotransferase domain-containing protein [Idiomarina abyssalis]MBJ7274009.1 sulfotransferase domain-containing protein [Idiomarina abyssalis]MBJ7314885.1 sulfotransferase domain-containing protein [Idiomarina abyssalis]